MGEERTGRSRRDGGPDQATSFGVAAAEYDRVRPGYPAAVLSWALGDEPVRVVDLGAGTGKLTRLLSRAGHDVVAVEPDELMRRQLVLTCGPEVQVLAGTGEDLPLPDASVDAVVVAQAWHWMDHTRAAAEAARVLRPGGALVLLWNIREPDDALGRAVRDAVQALSPDLSARAGAGTRVEDLDASAPDPRLVADGRTSLDSSVRYGVDDFMALVATWSYVALAPRREELLAAVRRAAGALAADDGTVVLAQSVAAFRYRRT